MEEQLQVEQIEPKVQAPEYNVKPRFLARILSVLVDAFVLFLLAFGVYQLEMSTPISGEYRAIKNELITIIDDTKIETNYGYKYYDNEEKFDLYKSVYQTYKETDTENPNYDHYYLVLNYESISNEVKDAYTKSIRKNGTYQSRYVTYRFINYGLLMLATGSSELVLFFVIPLLNKRRATIGKYVAITSLISSKDVKAKWWQILIRFIFTLIVETALPLLYFSELATLLIVGGVNAVVILISRKSSRTLRDYVSFTKIIDKKSFKPINEQ